MGESGVVTNIPVLSPHTGGHPALQERGAAFGAGVQDPNAAPTAKSPVEGMFSPVIGPGVFATAGPHHAPASVLPLGNILAAVQETKRAFCRAGSPFVSPSLPFSPWRAFYPALCFRALS